MESTAAAVTLAIGFELGRVSARTEGRHSHLTRTQTVLAVAVGLGAFLLGFKIGQEYLGNDAAGILVGVVALEAVTLFATHENHGMNPKLAPTLPSIAPLVTTPQPQPAVVAIARSGRVAAEG